MRPLLPNEPNPGLDRVRHELRATGVKLEAANPLRSGVHSRGYLPHVKREGASYFVTFRLADALPKDVVLQFEAEKADRLRRLHQERQRGGEITESEDEIERDFRRRIERYLDRGCGACHLGRPAIADLACGAIGHFDGRRYFLADWVVMPNHVHAVFWPTPNEILGEILKSWKQWISRRAKPIVGIEQERFWQPESFDHWIRNDDEKARICRYIRNNPVTAGLCRAPEEWRWGSAWPGWKTAPAPTRS